MKGLFNSAKEKLNSVKNIGQEKIEQVFKDVESFIKSNSELIIKTFKDNNLTDLFSDIEKINSSIKIISPFIHGLLPLPLQLTISEERLQGFLIKNSNLLFDIFNKENK